MKLTNKLEKEIREVYDTYWNGYMQGDMEVFSVILDEDVKVIGSTENEVFFNKQDALNFYLPTADQIAGKAELRNRNITITAAGNLVLVTEHNDFYILIEDNWNFYAKGRLSTFFHKKDGSWKIIQQHGSMPDIRAVEGEQFALEKISKENLELRDAVKRRTTELEQKNRELEIEASLERVRTVAMSMNKADDMLDVCRIISEQMGLLGTADIRNVQTAIFYSEKKIYRNYEYYSRHDKSMVTDVDYTTDKRSRTFAEKMQSGAGEFFTDGITGKAVQDWYEFQKTTTQFPDLYLETATSLTYYWFSLGPVALGCSTYTPLTDEEIDVFKRFRNVFELAYRRFLDIQQAAAQAREAQIEAALERVRSKTMAMHNSNDVGDTVHTMFNEFVRLGIHTNRCGILIFSEEPVAEVWTARSDNEGRANLIIGKLDLTIHPLLEGIHKAWKKKESFYSYIMEGDDLKNYYEALNNLQFYPVKFEISALPSNEFHSDYFFTEGTVFAFTAETIPEELSRVIKRFAAVFGQTYRRYLDLQRAESQSRETQIELGLERVRARAMAMQKSDELKELIGTVFTELTKLDLVLTRCVIMIFDNTTNTSKWWMANSEALSNPIGLAIPYHKHIPYLDYLKAWKEKQLKLEYVLEGKMKKDWDNFLFAETELSTLPEFVIEGMKSPDKVFLNASFNSFGNLTLASLEPLTAEHFDIMLRFAKVFDLTYTRFNDLQKAEAQAREAQIESALEKVRSRTLAMQKSDELSETAAEVFRQLIALGIEPNRLYIGLVNDESGNMEMWATDEDGTQVGKKFIFNKNENSSVLKLYDGWKAQKKSVIVDMQGEELENYFHYLSNVMQIPFKGGLSQKRRVQSVAYFSKGFIGMASPDGQGDETIQLLERFAAVFNLTYTRFNDLQVAEAQTHKAKIETALERVRARALAMQQPEELKEVAEVLRHEMGLLGVEELETCSIYINDEQAEKAECWYALKDIRSDEKKLVNDHFSLNLNDTWVGRGMLQFYNSGAKQTSIVMQGVNRKEWIKYCEENSAPFRGYYGDVIPDRTYHLYKFSHGAIGAASAGDISSESWDLLQRAASVFSLAYSRFKDLTQARIDLQRLKEEKQRAEDALSELQVTQRQLIQSEKMASLGELTAGIAHEIQNPLNFVNNFSEVSTELLDEMIAELGKSNPADAIAIADDLKQNLEKILHHGKRADGIVKGMLQHSRSSSGVKEPTNINVLADEYLRLAYHGLRAKDKSFNATLNTDYDETIGDINIIPQDIGRAVLNLITNAFYAVGEKKKQMGDGYEPTVSISTKRTGSTIEVKVKDNGNGIPQKVFDKIFQPFFTTKPTGQGTGLGLSLSYDIVKSHRGELKVETKEGEGTEFVISLPG